MPTNQVASIHIEGIPPINDAVDLTLDPRVNLLIGPNGCGKSTVLRALVSALRDPACWTDSRYENRTVRIDLHHELREIHSADVPHDLEEEYGMTEHHDASFKQAVVDYGNLVTGWWWQIADFNGELPPDLKIPFVYVPATRLPFPRKDDIVSAYVLSEDTVSDDVFDSRRAFRTMERFENPDIAADLATLTNDETMRLEIKGLNSGDPWYVWNRLSEAASARKNKMHDVAVTCAARICDDILKPQALSEHSHSTESGLRGERGIQQVGYPYWRPHTYDDRSEDPITIGELSAGTQEPLMWIWHLVAQLHDFFVTTYRHQLTHCQYLKIGNRPRFAREDGGGDESEWLTPEQFDEAGSPPGYKEVEVRVYTGEKISWEEYRNQGAPREYFARQTLLPDEDADEWRRMPFILLIDEIENHLHPAWQRRVIPALVETFPNMQLIATTHSPFVVAGREAGQVHRLFRDDKGGEVLAETSDEDIVGWTVEDILREFMEIDDPTDEYTAVEASALRWLRKEKPESGELAEDWRQRRLSELSDPDAPDTFHTWARLRWLRRHSTLAGEALGWWRGQIEQLEERVNPRVEFQWPERAERERYIVELENYLWALEERSGEDLLGTDDDDTTR